MSVTSSQGALTDSPLAGEILARDLPTLLQRLPASVEVLSFDCFDTLLWRNTSLPADVFFDLQRSAPFRALNFHARLRIQAEGRARELQLVRRGRSEVTLDDIYRMAFPELSDGQLEALRGAELSAEKRACRALAPAVDLLLAAKRRGLRIVVASDTYLREVELRELLAHALSPDAYSAIDDVFCSVDLGYPKARGMLKHMLERLRVRPAKVLHVGDHLEADYRAARSQKMHAVRVMAHDELVTQAMRLQGTAVSLLLPAVRNQRSLPSPFRTMIAERLPLPEPSELLGYIGAGPVLYAFAKHILQRCQDLTAEGKRVRPLFLLRDAHLPQRVCEAVQGDAFGHAVAISRFASYAASWRSADDVARYLARFGGSPRREDLLKQLLVPEERWAGILRYVEKASHEPTELVRQVMKPDVLTGILEASRSYRERLKRYLDVTVGVERGDTLLFIDLGYEGTAQRQLQTVFREEYGVEIEGCYLLAVRVPGGETTRSGLLDPSFCDDRTLGALVPYVALLEDICTFDDASVVDYTESGQTVLGEHVIAHEQYERIRPIQEACVRFARDAEAFFANAACAPDGEDLRVAALAALARLLYFPTEPEIEYLEGFRLDMNLATIDSFALFDRELGLSGLRTRGLFFMEQDLGSLRMNYPIELRTAGLELSLALLAQHRFALEFTQADLSLRRERLEVMVATGGQPSITEVTAQATHDGCFALVVPVGRCEYSIGVLFGKGFEWVQVLSVDLIAVAALYGRRESLATTPVENVQLERMERHAGGLLHCIDSSAFLFVAPEPPNLLGGIMENRVDARGYAVRIVYRPITRRG